MKPEILIPIIVVAVIVVVAVVVLLIILKKRPKNNEMSLAAKNRQAINQNARAMDSLITLAKNGHQENNKLVADLKELQEKLQFLIASEKSEVQEFDKKIGNYIGDLRVELTKSNGEYTQKVNSILLQIKLCVDDRNVRL